MKIAVCDDEKVYRDEIIELLNIYSAENNIILDITEFEDGVKLVSSKTVFDMIFLDHQMNDLNGLDTIKSIRQKNIETKVVFVSSYSEIVFDSMKYNAFRFIVKPVSRDKLFEAMDSALEMLNNERRLIVKDEEYNESIVVYEKEVIYAQADNVYTYIITDKGSYRYPYNLSALEEELDSGGFFRTNRSYIVNLEHINSYDKTGIILSNGHKAVISRGKYKEFNNCYLNYIKKSASR
ncbi:LytTR family DNA-binding domain-containing protein [uncultured Ruminococcus sp.]|uniref:LytR/AlgR family response regulator transcription factor n=1 Tax=uncultured Ruminococcus sp. TaxID=165186 RepID=UPI0025EEA5CA|nr:LytTR family DNA-binding domain-containing protein [uncultured Ruminococcus sp.]